MKRKTVHWEKSISINKEDSFQKRPKVVLTEEDIIGIKECFTDYIELKYFGMIKTLFNQWEKEHKLGKLLSYVNYQPFYSVLKDKDYSFFCELVSALPQRQKFLMVSHNNYDLIKSFIYLSIKDINEEKYNPTQAQKVFDTLLNINPTTIIEVIENFLNEQREHHPNAVEILHNELQAILSSNTISKNINSVHEDNAFLEKNAKDKVEMYIKEKEEKGTILTLKSKNNEQIEIKKSEQKWQDQVSEECSKGRNF